MFLQVSLVHRLLRSLNCHEQRPADEHVLLRLPLARLPPLLVGASQEVLPDFALGKNRVATDTVDETLQLVHTVLDELTLISA